MGGTYIYFTVDIRIKAIQQKNTMILFYLKNKLFGTSEYIP